MATFFFDGSENLTLNGFDVENDQVVFELEASEVASVTNNNGSATLTTTTGATLTFTGLTFAALADANLLPADFLIIGDDDDNGTLDASEDGSVIVANDGDDDLDGSTGNDLLLGNMGEDTITSGGGSDRIYGGMDDDLITVDPSTGADDTQEAADDIVFVAGGQGSDDINVTAFEGNATIYGGDTGVDTADDADDIDIALLDDASVLVTGNGGDDTIDITGATGSATVYGGQGDDVINASVETGLFFGNIGEDDITVTATDSVSIYGGQDSDDITASVSGGESAIFGNLGDDDISIQGVGEFTVYGGQGDDNITSAANLGAASSVLVYAGIGEDDVTITTAGDLTVYGGNGVDGSTEDGVDTITITLNGATDDQSILVEGNLDNDVISINGDGEITVYGGEGDDVINGGAGTLTLNDDSAIYGGAGEDQITATVAGDNVSIFGGNGLGDTADGGDAITLTMTTGGEATVYGLGGDDTIIINGTAGEASVFGGTGDDILRVNNQAQVTFTGGEGDDTFAFATSSDDATPTDATINVITDINFDDDALAFQTIDVTVAVDLSDTTEANQDIIDAAASLDAAADEALQLASGTSVVATTGVGVLFNYGGESYVAVGAAAAGDTETATTVVQVTGFTGDFDAGSFDNAFTF